MPLKRGMVKKMKKTYRKKRMYKKKFHIIPRRLDSVVHRFKEILRKKIFVNSATITVPGNNDIAGTQYRYVSGLLQDFVNLTSTGAVAPSSGDNFTLNNILHGGLKTIFDQIKIDYFVFKFTPTNYGLDFTNTQLMKAPGNLYVYIDKDGGVAPNSLGLVRERGNVKRINFSRGNKTLKIIAKPYTHSITADITGTNTAYTNKRLYWMDIQRLYTGSSVGVPLINLGAWFVEVPTNSDGSSLTAPTIDLVIDCQIDVYYSCKNQL